MSSIQTRIGYLKFFNMMSYNEKWYCKAIEGCDCNKNRGECRARNVEIRDRIDIYLIAINKISELELKIEQYKKKYP